MTKDLVFIASGGRTGTTFFGHELGAAIDNCWSEHEPDVFSQNWQKTLSRFGRFGINHMLIGRLNGTAGLRPLGHRLLAGNITTEECVDRVKESRAKYHASISQDLIIESSGRWWMFAGHISEFWPDAKMIGVVRDPREWIESWRRHQPHRHSSDWKRWFPLGPLKPEDVGDSEWIGKWDGLSQFEKLAWDWRVILKTLDDAASRCAHVRVFRFEDIFSDDSAALDELLLFATTHGDKKYAFKDIREKLSIRHNKSSGHRRAWKSWLPEELLTVDKMCGNLMTHYGYGGEPEWQDALASAKEQSAL